MKEGAAKQTDGGGILKALSATAAGKARGESRCLGLGLRPLLFLALHYLGVLAFFAVGKLMFLLFLSEQTPADFSVPSRLAEAVWYGLPLDIATAGYLGAPLLIVLLVGVWTGFEPKRLGRRLHAAYALLLAAMCTLGVVTDAALYPFWGFKLDATVFNYIEQPSGAIQSVTPGFVAVVVGVYLVYAVAAYFLFSLPRRVNLLPSRHRVADTLLLLLVGALMFLGIRGGVGRSTMNVGVAYYSNDAVRNHAAVNPLFSLFSSLDDAKNYSSQFNFFSETECRQIFGSMGYPAAADTAAADTAFSLLCCSRPNVLVIVMEGMGAQFVESLGGKSGVTPRLDSLRREGVWFTNCYANSFRTDRGTVSTLSGYPGCPTVSVMRVQRKVNSIAGIARSLARAGYNTEFLYGGDVNFTNTKGYLLQTGYATVLGDEHFPISVRRTHGWGVTDRIVFDTLYNRLLSKPAGQPWHETLLTLASHEPWEVPYDRIKDDVRSNAFAYLDDCLGSFIDRLRQTPVWDNTLVVVLPDHGIRYPEGTGEEQPEKHHIPMLWTGGAVAQPCQVDPICNQSDMAATLLAQLRLPHDDFPFSRNVLSSNYRPIAFFTWAGGIGCVDPTGTTVFDTRAQRTISEQPAPSPERLRKAKAYLQTVYDDLERI